jgi:hypothetical protein
MALSKKEQREKINKLERKALALDKKKGNGAKVNKLLEQVIRLEDKYFKQYGRHPSKQYGAVIDGRKPIKRNRKKESYVWE